MNKKLLLTSALTGVLLSSSVLAQTSVTGNMTLGFRTTAEKGAAGVSVASSKQSFLRETQLNIANKGKLNVGGLDYAAGFSLEFDAPDTASKGVSSVSNENVYIDLINPASGTLVSFGIDHILDADRTMIPVVGELGKPTGAGGGSTIETKLFTDKINVNQSMGVSLEQKFGMVTLTGQYTPTFGCTTTDIAGCGGADTAAVEGNEGSGYGYLIQVGPFNGVKAEYMLNEVAKKVGSTTSPARDARLTSYGLNYTISDFVLGYNFKKFVDGVASTTTAGGDTKINSFGIGYNVTKELSLGAIQEKAKFTNMTGLTDETFKSVALGYNLGPVGFKVVGAKYDNMGGTSGAETKTLTLKLNTNF